METLSRRAEAVSADECESDDLRHENPEVEVRRRRIDLTPIPTPEPGTLALLSLGLLGLGLTRLTPTELRAQFSREPGHAPGFFGLWSNPVDIRVATLRKDRAGY